MSELKEYRVGCICKKITSNYIDELPFDFSFNVLASTIGQLFNKILEVCKDKEYALLEISWLYELKKVF